MLLYWATDLHFDHCGVDQYREFVEEVREKSPPFLLIAGDTREHESVGKCLSLLAEELDFPIYFVLGNHDFYGSSIEKVRGIIEDVVEKNPLLTYLTPLREVILLSSDVALIGHDGWADGKAGDYASSDVMLRDYVVIDDLALLEKEERGKKLNALGEQSAKQLKVSLESALDHATTVVCVTHAPPFPEACYYENMPSTPEWAPHFVNLSMGNMLVEVMEQHPEKSLLVLCGHTHHEANYSPLPNLRVVTGHADYGFPSLQPPIDPHS